MKPASECRFDEVSLGEVMLRLDPGEGRIHTTRAFRVSEGGGEYNVARGLRRCFGQRTAIVTALADNPVGRLIEDLLLQGGVDLSTSRFSIASVAAIRSHPALSTGGSRARIRSGRSSAAWRTARLPCRHRATPRWQCSQRC